MTFNGLNSGQQQGVEQALGISTGRIEFVIVYVTGSGPTVYIPDDLGHVSSADTNIPFSAISSRILTSKRDISSCGEGERKIVVDTANAVEAVCARCR